jgi:hypothetical protein
MGIHKEATACAIIVLVVIVIVGVDTGFVADVVAIVSEVVLLVDVC